MPQFQAFLGIDKKTALQNGKLFFYQSLFLDMVRRMGLEPTRAIHSLPPQSSASAIPPPPQVTSRLTTIRLYQIFFGLSISFLKFFEFFCNFLKKTAVFRIRQPFFAYSSLFSTHISAASFSILSISSPKSLSASFTTPGSVISTPAPLSKSTGVAELPPLRNPR